MPVPVIPRTRRRSEPPAVAIAQRAHIPVILLAALLAASCGMGALELGEELRLWARGQNGEYRQGQCASPASDLDGPATSELLEDQFGEAWQNPEAVPPLKAGLGGGAVLLTVVPLLAVGALGLAAVIAAVLVRRARR